MSEIPEQFKVALSFANGQRTLAKDVAKKLEVRLGEGTVFFDMWYQPHLAGPGGAQRLYEIYRQRARLVVQFISEEYESGQWTIAEDEQIQAQARVWQASRDESDHFRVFPLLAGEMDVLGHAHILADIRGNTVDETVDMIVDRLAKADPKGEIDQNKMEFEEKRKVVYLALCVSELEPRRNNVKAYLEDRGWDVLPKSDMREAAYGMQIWEDLKEAVAFVQLLGADPREGNLSDVVQYQCAIDVGKSTLRWRSESIDTKGVMERNLLHANFINAPDILVRDFEDFKNHVGRQLDSIWQQKRVQPSKGALTYIAICSRDPDSLWERAFDRIRNQGVGCYKLRREETFLARYQTVPCHGFIVICDDAAYEGEGQLSSQQCLDHCLQIQLREKDNRRRPPVGVMYWPPPSPLWSKLLGCIPLKLHQILGSHLEKLDVFFEEVKGTAR